MTLTLTYEPNVMILTLTPDDDQADPAPRPSCPAWCDGTHATDEWPAGALVCTSLPRLLTEGVAVTAERSAWPDGVVESTMIVFEVDGMVRRFTPADADSAALALLGMVGAVNNAER